MLRFDIVLQLGSDKSPFVCYLVFRIRTGDTKAKPKRVYNSVVYIMRCIPRYLGSKRMKHKSYIQ